VVTSEPTHGAANVVLDAAITLTFSEFVDRSSDWITIVCTSSGTRRASDLATVDNGLTIISTPSRPFHFGETCTLTVRAAAVTDEDRNDPPDTMAADYVASFGTTTKLLDEDFESGMPADWTLVDGDRRTVADQVSWMTAAWTVSEDDGDPQNRAAFSTSWYEPVGASDDWMFTPGVSVPPMLDCELRWRATTYDANFRDGYEVRVSTTGANVSGALVHEPLFTINAENAAWTQRSVILNSYQGRRVHLAFRNTSNDKFLLAVDDVAVVCSQ
jgi:hypothetical protein